MTAAGRFAFAAAVRVIDRVHRNAAVVRALAQPALASGLTQRNVFVIAVADHADRRHAVGRNAPHFARRQLQQRHRAFARNQLRLRAGRTRHLRALARPQFDVVDDGAGRNVLQRQGIAHQNIGVGTRGNRCADLQAVRRDDVTLLAIRIIQQRDARRTVRIVFDRRDFSRNARTCRA